MDIYLQRIEEGSSVVLKNIFFETGAYIPKSQSKAELDEIIGFLKENPNIKVEISGHTDNVGDKTYNIKLSENRAREVAGYLVENGINSDRVTYKGYGETQPIADNSTKENRALNRRIAFKIISK